MNDAPRVDPRTTTTHTQMPQQRPRDLEEDRRIEQEKLERENRRIRDDQDDEDAAADHDLDEDADEDAE